MRLKDEREEAARVAEAILASREEFPSRRVAVLFRTHAQTRVIKEELVRRNVPHRVIGGAFQVAISL